MRLDKFTLHSWAHQEVTIQSEEDWVLCLTQTGHNSKTERILVVPREFRDLKDCDPLSHFLVDEILAALLKIETPQERDYTIQLLSSVLPYLL